MAGSKSGKKLKQTVQFIDIGATENDDLYIQDGSSVIDRTTGTVSVAAIDTTKRIKWNNRLVAVFSQKFQGPLVKPDSLRLRINDSVSGETIVDKRVKLGGAVVFFGKNITSTGVSQFIYYDSYITPADQAILMDRASAMRREFASTQANGVILQKVSGGALGQAQIISRDLFSSMDKSRLEGTAKITTSFLPNAVGDVTAKISLKNFDIDASELYTSIPETTTTQDDMSNAVSSSTVSKILTPERPCYTNIVASEVSGTRVTTIRPCVLEK